MLVAWRRGDVVVQLDVQHTPVYLGPGRTQAPSRKEMATVEELARTIDARLEQVLR